jgi:hypothetical protein
MPKKLLLTLSMPLTGVEPGLLRPVPGRYTPIGRNHIPIVISWIHGELGSRVHRPLLFQSQNNNFIRQVTCLTSHSPCQDSHRCPLKCLLTTVCVCFTGHDLRHLMRGLWSLVNVFQEIALLGCGVAMVQIASAGALWPYTSWAIGVCPT